VCGKNLEAVLQSILVFRSIRGNIELRHLGEEVPCNPETIGFI
jgi:hypothetical protein